MSKLGSTRPKWLTRVRMRRDFLNQLIEKYFEQLIDSGRVLRPHCRNFKANDFTHCQAHMRCTAALDESVHQIWRNRFVYSWVLTRSCSVSLKQKLHCFCVFWPRNFTKFIHELIKFHIWNNWLFQMPFERVELASAQPNALVFSLNRPTTMTNPIPCFWSTVKLTWILHTAHQRILQWDQHHLPWQAWFHSASKKEKSISEKNPSNMKTVVTGTYTLSDT